MWLQQQHVCAPAVFNASAVALSLNSTQYSHCPALCLLLLLLRRQVATTRRASLCQCCRTDAEPYSTSSLPHPVAAAAAAAAAAPPGGCHTMCLAVPVLLHIR
jgi:hypothetical protein